jgi:hypothetical protein
MTEFNFRLKGADYSSTLSDVEAATALRANSSEFATSLRERFGTTGKWSEKQRMWAHKLALDSKNGKVETKSVALALTFSTIKKWVREYDHKVYNVFGQKVTFSIATDKSKTPGAINCTDGGPFGENKYFGRILPKVSDKEGHATFQVGKDMTDDIQRFVLLFGEDPEEVIFNYETVTVTSD